MKAQDLVKATQIAEGEVLKEIEKIVAGKINQLCSDTGLEIAGVNINLAETTAHGDQHKNYVVTQVLIETRLP